MKALMSVSRLALLVNSPTADGSSTHPEVSRLFAAPYGMRVSFSVGLILLSRVGVPEGGQCARHVSPLSASYISSIIVPSARTREIVGVKLLEGSLGMVPAWTVRRCSN